MILHLLSQKFVYGVQAVFEIIHVFLNMPKKFIKSFYEIKNQKSVAFVIQKCS